ncbi:MAG: hypothetical protein M5R40_08130 [Anaerolineae bacterium]|nr:hypothetical protein [Anaerolineae bacterium]
MALTLAATVVAMGVQPALAQDAVIQGVVFNDLNGDGTYDTSPRQRLTA